MNDNQPNLTVVGPGFGTLSSGFDLRDLSSANVQQLSDSIQRHLVAVFPGQHLTDDEHVELASKFGQLLIHPYLADHESGTPELISIAGIGPRASLWHADETFLATPPQLCIMRVVSLPQAGGGTAWVDMRAVLNAARRHLKYQLDDLVGLHSTIDGDREFEHPLVVHDPAAESQSLFANPMFTRAVIGVQDCVGQRILNCVFSCLDKSTFRFVREWRVGDVAIWHNIKSVHRVISDFEGFRATRRAAVHGVWRTAKLV